MQFRPSARRHRPQLRGALKPDYLTARPAIPAFRVSRRGWRVHRSSCWKCSLGSWYAVRASCRAGTRRGRCGDWAGSTARSREPGSGAVLNTVAAFTSPLCRPKTLCRPRNTVLGSRNTVPFRNNCAVRNNCVRLPHGVTDLIDAIVRPSCTAPDDARWSFDGVGCPVMLCRVLLADRRQSGRAAAQAAEAEGLERDPSYFRGPGRAHPGSFLFPIQWPGRSTSGWLLLGVATGPGSDPAGCVVFEESRSSRRFRGLG